MTKIYTAVVILMALLSFSCQQREFHEVDPNQAFSKELVQLKEYFSIPGMSASIAQSGELVYQEYFGDADIKNQTKVDSATVFPIASITKVFSGVLVMKLAEQGKLFLDDPIDNYLEEAVAGDSILVKHILSHTSQGEVGKKFYYSSRFGLLTRVVEQASGKSFATAMRDEIFTPLQLKNTFLLKDSIQVSEKGAGFAQPYVLNDGIEAGFIDYGYSASAGVVSNLEDMSLFNRALDENSLISKQSKELMFSSFKEELPYGYGIFSQEFDKMKLVWAYGQYDCYSSLLLKIPEKDLTLTLLANNNLMSDPARLIYGDVTASLFTLSFLKNYVYDQTEMPLLENSDSIASIALGGNEFLRKKIRTQALAESFMARFDPAKMESSAQLLRHYFSSYPDFLEEADLNLLHNLTFLKDVAFYMDLGEFDEFDDQILEIGNKLHTEDPNNPYVNVYLGTFHDRKGNTEKARLHFEAIVNAENFSSNWYTQEAQNWLESN